MGFDSSIFRLSVLADVKRQRWECVRMVRRWLAKPLQVHSLMVRFHHIPLPTGIRSLVKPNGRQWVNAEKHVA